MATKAYRTYTHLSSFYWRSSLSPKRIEELIAWVADLDDESVRNLEDLIQDAREDSREDALEGY